MIWLVPLVSLLTLGTASSPGARGEASHLINHLAAAAVAPNLSVVALGDSVPAGVDCDCDTYPAQVAERLAAGSDRTAKVDNFAHTGLVTTGLIDQLRSTKVRSAIGSADLVIITIGANDLDVAPIDGDCPLASILSCYRQAMSDLRTNLEQVASEVRSLSAASGGKVLMTGYWNVFLDGAVGQARGAGYVQAADKVTRQVNAIISEVASDSGARFVDLYQPFKGDGSNDCTSLLASDGDHPSAAGHQLIANALVASLRGVRMS